MIDPYHPLRSNQIRIAEVKYAFSYDEEIICSLLTVSRDNTLPYRALSYCCGPREELNQGYIILDVDGNGLRWSVTPALEMSPRRLRYTDGKTSLLLWGDTLCCTRARWARARWARTKATSGTDKRSSRAMKSTIGADVLKCRIPKQLHIWSRNRCRVCSLCVTRKHSCMLRMTITLTLYSG